MKKTKLKRLTALMLTTLVALTMILLPSTNALADSSSTPSITVTNIAQSGNNLTFEVKTTDLGWNIKSVAAVISTTSTSCSAVVLSGIGTQTVKFSTDVSSLKPMTGTSIGCAINASAVLESTTAVTETKTFLSGTNTSIVGEGHHTDITSTVPFDISDNTVPRPAIVITPYGSWADASTITTGAISWIWAEAERTETDKKYGEWVHFQQDLTHPDSSVTLSRVDVTYAVDNGLEIRIGNAQHLFNLAGSSIDKSTWYSGDCSDGYVESPNGGKYIQPTWSVSDPTTSIMDFYAVNEEIPSDYIYNPATNFNPSGLVFKVDATYTKYPTAEIKGGNEFTLNWPSQDTFSVTKTVSSSQTTFYPGQTIPYQIVITNNNPEYGLYLESVTDYPFPEAVSGLSGGSLSAAGTTGSSRTLNYNYPVTTSTTVGALKNTVTVVGIYGEQDTVTKTADVTVNIGRQTPPPPPPPPPANNYPPVAVNDSYTTKQDTALTVGVPGIVQNDSDPEGSALSAALVTNPSNGTLTLNPNGSFVYTPNHGFSGTDSYTYKVSDTNGNISNIATVTITVNPVILPPETPNGPVIDIPEPTTPSAPVIDIPEPKTPSSPALPKTGGIPSGLFFGIGSAITGLGILIRKKK